MKHIILAHASALALLSMSSFAYAQTTDDCPPGMTTGSCNITVIGDQTHDNSQTVADSHDNVYAPDSATANASTGAIDVDAVGQGGTASSTATGNHSTNNNQSSANNNATNTMTNGSITNDVTGGNITGGSLTQTGSADITNSGGNVTGGTATTNSGNVAGGAGGSVGNVETASSAVSGASTSTASGGNIAGSGNSQSKASGGSVAGSGNSSSRSVVSGSGNSRNTNNNKTGNQTTNVDASNNSRYEYKEASRTAATVLLPGYGPQNCYGDTNPSGSFGASIQTFGWGATASRSKASNVCAMTQVGAGLERGAAGSAIAAGYLAAQDPMAYRALSTTINPATDDYYILTPQERQRRAEVAEAERKAASQVQPKQARLACPDDFTLIFRDDGTAVCRKAGPDLAVPAKRSGPPTGTVCPAGSSWNGKGCWKPAR